MTRLAILGASGHGRVIADAALLAGWLEVVFFDDAPVAGGAPWRILGDTKALLASHTRFDGAIVGIGNNDVRLAKHRELASRGIRMVSIVHPAAVVSPRACVGEGSAVLAGGIINPFATTGVACIVNTGASVDHDCILADGVHVSPGARLGGTVRVGECSWVGIGAAVREGICIGARVKVGAGAAVVDDVADDATVVGVPARPLQNTKK